ncbi:MAG TPA: hypothetical protein PKD64_03615 [Pirellulaceae bacterium]|nr:hypothetical protein [Pirellulaceae bacterium]HMO91258.1 hypothetical protein [Pirellulaceae bacterium]HMP68558.1 hypothetical protein [Pirellulaceae bacterium]
MLKYSSVRDAWSATLSQLSGELGSQASRGIGGSVVLVLLLVIGFGNGHSLLGTGYASAQELDSLGQETKSHVNEADAPFPQGLNPLNQIPGWRPSTLHDFLVETAWPSRHPMLLNTIMHIRHLPWEKIAPGRPLLSDAIPAAQWPLTREDLADGSLEKGPGDERLGQAFEIIGTVTRVVTVKLSEEQKSQFGFEHYHIATIQVLDHVLQVACRLVPHIWAKSGQQLSESVRCPALLLKWVEQKSPLFVTDSISWFPQQTNPQLNVLPSHVWLARHGIDIGARERIVQRSTTAIGHQETDIVMEMLKLTANNATRPNLTPELADLEGWLKRPEARFGTYHQFQGRVKRISVVEVEADSLRAKFGMDRYYQLDVSIAAPDIRILDPTGEQLLDEHGQPLVYSNQYGIGILCTALPSEIDMRGKLSLETDLLLEFEGFFLKRWEQRNFRTRNISADLVKSTPLLVAFRPRLADGPATFNWSYTLAVSLLGIFLVLFFMGFLWLGQSDKLSRNQRSVRQLPDTIEIRD